VDISGSDLRAEVLASLNVWPFIVTIEVEYRLPPWLLFAVGSRETNLTNEVGDGGHGYGVWQLDNRSHNIPADFPVSIQALYAARMLADELLRTAGDIQAAAAIYNSGQPDDAYTTGHDYGADVVARRNWCEANLTYPSTGGLDEMLSDPAFAVRLLYRLCLRREADEAGFALYVGQLSSGAMTLDAVMADLQDSPEGQAVIAAERKALALS